MSTTYTEPLGDSFQYDPDYNRMCDYLGIDVYERRDLKTAQKVSHLTDWALTKSKSKRLEDAMTKITKLIKDKGINNTNGQTLVNQLYQDVRLKEDVQTIQDRTYVQKKLEKIEATNKVEKIEPIEVHSNDAEKQARAQFEVIKGGSTPFQHE